MGETLQKANVSWQVLQGADNFDDNGAFQLAVPFVHPLCALT